MQHEIALQMTAKSKPLVIDLFKKPSVLKIEPIFYKYNSILTNSICNKTLHDKDGRWQILVYTYMTC